MIEHEKHVFIGGITRSGKTVYASEYFKDTEGFRVFFNVQEEYEPQYAADYIVHNIDEVMNIIQEENLNDMAICYNPELAGDDISITDIKDVSNICFAIGAVKKQQVKGQPDIWCRIFIDEIQEFGEKSGDPIIHRLWKRGLSYGIQCIGISQRPADVSHTVLTQSKDHVIFKMSKYEEPYFKRYNIPMEEHKDWILLDYHFLIWDGEEMTRYTPLRI